MASKFLKIISTKYGTKKNMEKKLQNEKMTIMISNSDFQLEF